MTIREIKIATVFKLSTEFCFCRIPKVTDPKTGSQPEIYDQDDEVLEPLVKHSDVKKVRVLADQEGGDGDVAVLVEMKDGTNLFLTDYPYVDEGKGIDLNIKPEKFAKDLTLMDIDLQPGDWVTTIQGADYKLTSVTESYLYTNVDKDYPRLWSRENGHHSHATGPKYPSNINIPATIANFKQAESVSVKGQPRNWSWLTPVTDCSTLKPKLIKDMTLMDIDLQPGDWVTTKRGFDYKIAEVNGHQIITGGVPKRVWVRDTGCCYESEHGHTDIRDIDVQATVDNFMNALSVSEPGQPRDWSWFSKHANVDMGRSLKKPPAKGRASRKPYDGSLKPALPTKKGKK